MLPKPGHEADLKQRTLTHLYNQRPAWLQNAHQTLDHAVAAAYGWPDHPLPETDILTHLLTLNRSR
ncbi:type IIL restriction-modification enzyme MmeI [Thiorhodospira sibirica]|uniref:type IIL restriction-modification enzyme MmeI n=1 Tax=Thiorhodospira sibirica TaxID=154347 RepID=UPI00300CF3F2